MIRKVFIFVIFFSLAGCQTLPPKDNIHVQAPSQNVIPLQSAEKQEEPKGTIFAKTEFEGVVKRSFIRLTIIDQQDRKKVYQLYIGDKSRQLDFPWSTQTIQPGYFAIDLPPGSYVIGLLSIPVGSSLATEIMNITFDVKADETTYLGTLKVVGTKEKIKLGGIPVIKPGFDYVSKILNEYAEALEEFKQRFPQNNARLNVRLMRDLSQEKWSQDGHGSGKPQQNL